MCLYVLCTLCVCVMVCFITFVLHIGKVSKNILKLSFISFTSSIYFSLCLTQESENGNFSGFPTKPKAGRRRWGHTTGGLKDDWDDYEDIETTITLLGKTAHPSEKRRQAEGASSRSFSPVAFSIYRCCSSWKLFSCLLICLLTDLPTYLGLETFQISVLPLAEMTFPQI